MSGDEEQPQQRQGEEEERGASRATSPSPPGTQQQFMFVDSSAERGRSREAIRVHVMRESHRARRAGQGQPEPSVSRGELQIWDSSSSSSSPSSQGPRTRPSSQWSIAVSGPQELSADPAPSMIGPRRPSVRRPPPVEGNIRLAVAPRGTETPTHPAALLESSRRPPFRQNSTLPPFAADALMDQYATQFDSTYSELLPIYRNAEASLHALLAFAATDEVPRQGQSLLVASQAEAATLKILRDRLVQTQVPQTPGTILAVAIMAHLEERRGSSKASRIHWQAMTNMLQERGGLDSLNDSRPLQAQLLRLDTTICTTAESSLNRPYVVSQHGSLPLATVSSAPQATSDQILPDGTTRAEAQQIIGLGEEFLDFFNEIRTTPQTSTSKPTTFRVPPVITSILNTPLTIDPTDPHHRLLDCTKLSILLYLAAAKLEHQDSQSGTNSFLATLAHEIQQRTSHSNIFLEELLYTMFLSSPLHARLVSRHMSIARKLFSGSWQLASQILGTYTGLSSVDETAFSSSYAAQWDTDAIRREINGALYPMLSSLREGARSGR